MTGRIPGLRGRARPNRGFTLIELLIVMAIIGTLLSIAVPRYFRSLQHARETVLKQDLSILREAIDKYQPMLSLHGHIHEGKGITRLGKTLSINPGSAYEEGMLLASIIELDQKKGIKNYQLVNG